MKYLHIKRNLALFMTAAMVMTGTPVIAGAQEYEGEEVFAENAEADLSGEAESSEEVTDFSEEAETAEEPESAEKPETIEAPENTEMPENTEGLEQQEAESEEADAYDQQETEAVDTLEEVDTEKPEESAENLETDFDSGEEDSAAGSDLDSALENIKEISADTEITIPAVQDPTMSDFFFTFTPSQSGFYHAETSLGVYGPDIIRPYMLNGYHVYENIGSLWNYQPYLKKGQKYTLRVSSFSGNGGTFSVHLTKAGNYDAYPYAGRSYSGDVTWTFDGTRLAVSTTERKISYTGPFIGSYCFGQNAKVKEVVIEEGPTEIEDGSIFFAGDYFTELEKIELPASLTVIGSEFLKDAANLKTVTVPANSSLKNIKEDAFANTPYYASLTGEYGMLGNVVLKYQGKNASTTVPSNTKAIAGKSMASCKTLKSVTIPKSVETIGYAAFRSDTLLEKVTLNEGLKTIEAAAFMGCDSLHEITIPKSVTLIRPYAIGYSHYNYEDSDEKDPYAIGQKYTDPNHIVINCWYNSQGYLYAKNNGFPYKLLDKKNLGNSEIAWADFAQTPTTGNTKVTATVYFAGNKLKAGTDYTYKVEYLSNRRIKVTVTGKGSYSGTLSQTIYDDYYHETKPVPLAKGKTFTAGTSRYKVTGNRVVTYIGTTNKNATKITIGNTITYKKVTYKITSVYTKSLRKNTKVSQISIGNNVTVIGTSAFEGCTALKSVTIGTGVTTIGKDAFKSCKKISAITIRSTKLKTVGSNAFRGIYAKAKIRVPSAKLKAYQKLLKNKGQGSKVVISR